MKDIQLSGGPAWINSERYDIAFTLTRPDQSADSRSLPNPVSSTVQQKKLFDKALQSMLAEQCYLSLKSGKTEMEVYSLKSAESGPRVSEAQIQTPADGKEPTFGTKVMVRNGTGQLAMTGPITGLVNAISLQLDREVIDLTGLRANYDLMLHWSIGPSVSNNLAAAVQEQLGLQLSLQRHAVQTLAVEQVEVPSEK